MKKGKLKAFRKSLFKSDYGNRKIKKEKGNLLCIFEAINKGIENILSFSE